MKTWVLWHSSALVIHMSLNCATILWKGSKGIFSLYAPTHSGVNLMHYVHAVVGGTAGWGSGISSISVCDCGLEEAVPGRVLLWSGQARQQQQQQLASLVPPSPASLGLGWEHCQPATQSPAFVVPQMHNWRSGSLNYYLKRITAHMHTHRL